MSKALRLFFAIITLLTCLLMLGLSVWALTVPIIGMAIVCFMLAAGFGLFVYMDYKFFFGGDSDESTQ